MKLYALAAALIMAVLLAPPAFAKKAPVIFHFDSSLTLNQPSPFSGVRVVNLKKGAPGLIFTGGYGLGKSDLLTAGTFEEEVASLGNRLFAGQPSAKDSLLVLIYEHGLSFNADKGLLSLSINIAFFKGSAGAYRHLYTADSFFEAYNSNKKETWREMHNVTWLHNFAMAAAMAGQPKEPVYTLEEAINRPQTIKAGLPVYNTATYPTGIYFTREEFLNLKPGLTVFKEWDNGEDAPYPHLYYRQLENGKRGDRIEETGYYAVFNGKRWYKAGRSGLYQMHFVQGDFYFQAPMDGLKGKDGSLIMAGAAGGLIGLGLTAITNESRVANNAHAVAKRSVRLDAETGNYILDAPSRQKNQP